MSDDSLSQTAQKHLSGNGIGWSAPAKPDRFIFSHGKGSRLWDAEGREYIDYACGAGALILGHSHPALVKAMQEQAERGMHMFGVASDVAVRLAERLVCDIPCAEKIAYATTGSEATAYSMRLARAFTGREKVMKFEGAYHGNHDYAMVSTFPDLMGNYPQGSADTHGTPTGARDSMLIAPYNDLDAATRIAEEHAGDLAGIIVEPVQRIIRGEEEFLQGLRNLCSRLGAVLIFDEVVTGFRVAYGGAQAQSGILPDVAAFGKVIGAGGALSVVAGREEIMGLLDSARKGGDGAYAYFNGTLHGNPVGAAMTMALLDELSVDGVYDRLNAATDSFCREANEVLRRHGVKAMAANVGSLWQFLFTDKEPRNYRDIAAGDCASMRALDGELLRRGQYVLPGTRRFVSCVHTDADFEETLRALDEGCRALF
ncbi:MAG: aminotransferase class III-fold pyridoxal phosphate-dependent enzyme [Hyphomicrobiales bacterium]|nr:aminotransferase class III-fold pyridoxal phosphate-dependent enzyme [Hyphomicrobiales bacterium]